MEDDPADEDMIPSIDPPPPCRVSWEEYISAPPEECVGNMEGGREGGREGGTIYTYNMQIVFGGVVQSSPCLFFLSTPHLGRKMDLKVDRKHFKASICIVR